MKYDYFLFSDGKIWHREISANTWRAALALVRSSEQARGKLSIVEENYDCREYRMTGGYQFSLKGVRA